MLEMSYLIWSADPSGNFCTLEAIRNFDNPFLLTDGTPLADGFPEDAAYHMNASFPKDVKLPDNVQNNNGIPIVSKRLKEFLEAQDLGDVEYLPVTIVNHKGRVASPDYFILNPLTVLDVIDFEQSEVRWSAVKPDVIASASELVIDESKVPDGVRMLRPKSFAGVVMVDDGLVEELEAEDFTGLLFETAEEFTG